MLESQPESKNVNVFPDFPRPTFLTVCPSRLGGKIKPGVCFGYKVTAKLVKNRVRKVCPKAGEGLPRLAT